MSSTARTISWLPHPATAGYFLAVVVWCAALALGVADGATDATHWWSDHLPDPYVVTNYSLGYGFFFAPPIAFAIYPLTLLPWPLFAATWTGLSFAALGWLTGRWAAIALLIPIVWWEIHAANIALLVGAAVVLGFRWPATWSFVLLTKVTPGIGLLWFVVRREWRSLGIALGTTSLIVAVTFVFAPGLWIEWFGLLAANAGQSGPNYFTVPIPLTVRLALAALVVTWGALTDRRWTVVVAVTLGYPVLWFNALATLVAVVPLIRPPHRASREGSANATIPTAPEQPG